MTIAITGYYFGTEDGGESKFGTHKKILVVNIKYINAVLISHVICHVASFFFLILNNWQTGNGFKERNQVIDNIFSHSY